MTNDFLEALPKEAVESSMNMDLHIRSVKASQAIDDVLSKSVLKGGKRLRPLLTFLVAHLFKVDFKTVTPYARASELVHAASLSHDDVIDNATTRRGSPSINILASNKRAVLAGDYLLSSVIVDLSNAGNLELVKEMSLVIKDLSEGEWLQLDLIESKDYSRETIREIAEKKTSSVMSYCCLAPLVLQGADKTTIQLMRDFGRHLGLAFQLIDDTLDFSSHSEKDQELDLKNGIVNSVVFELLDASPDLFLRFKNGENLFDLVSKLSVDKYVEKISSEAHLHLEEASMIINKIELVLRTSSMYINDESELKKRIEALLIILSFMALRKS
jgi:geranylgeranyl pyrophosphate synthase